MSCRRWCVLPLLPLLLSVLVEAEWLFDGVDERQKSSAVDIGERARVAYLEKVQGVTDPVLRKNLYLDGLEECNRIDAAWTSSIEARALQQGRPQDAIWLEKAGLKTFTALFMTLPPNAMRETSVAACSKHEKQLTCGATFEGEAKTIERIEDLRTIGNHFMMFEKECRDIEYSPKVYPCIGTNVASWMAPCAELVDNYAIVRESVNVRIEDVYNTAVNAVKEMGPGPDGTEEFLRAMKTIAQMEGRKCHLFKTMRLCVLHRLLQQCGPEATRAFNTSVSLGYLRTERRERLNLDFQVFQYPVHPACTGL